MVASFFVVALILGTHWAQVEFFQPNPSGVMPHSWRMHTLRTAVDWIPSWQWLGYWMGGLNLHVTHHLFPHVNHRHYPALARIVAMVARDYDLPYRQIDYPTLLRLQNSFCKRWGKRQMNKQNMRVLILGARAPVCLEWARAFRSVGAYVCVADSLSVPLARFHAR